MELKNIDKILIIKLRAVGDVIMSTVVFDNLRNAFPKARIDFLTESESKDLLIGNPVLNQVHVYDRKHLLTNSFLIRSKENRNIIKKIRNQKYQLVFDFFGNPRSAWLTWLSGAKYRVGYDYRIRRFAYNITVASRADRVHEVDWHLDALDILGIPIISKSLNVYIGTGSRNFAESFWHESGLDKQTVFAINFSGGWSSKQWPLERFAHLIDQLSLKYKCKFLILWGPGEKEQAEEIGHLATTPVNLIPETNLTQLAAILEKVDLMITTDSGPMHVAAAVAIPCVTLFGPTDPALQGPYGTNHEIIKNDSKECPGCKQKKDDAYHTCMKAITVKDVLACVDRAIIKNDIRVG